MWRELNQKDNKTLEEFYKTINKKYFDSMRKEVEEGKAIGVFQEEKLIAPIIILENITEEGKKIGRVMNTVPKEKDIKWEYFCEWIKTNSKKYDYMVLYKFPKEEEENFKKYQIEVCEILVDYRLDLKNFKPYELSENLEEMKIEDFEEIHSVDTSAFSEIWHDSKEMVRERIKNKSEEMLQVVIKEKNKILAVGFSRIKEEKLGYINRLAVKPEEQGKGYGKILLRSALNFLYEKKAERVELSTQIKNKQSRPLYENHGFKALEEEYVYIIHS